MTTAVRIARAELQELTSDPRLLRQFERLFDLAGTEIPALVDEAGIAAANADNKAITALDLLRQLAAALETLPSFATIDDVKRLSDTVDGLMTSPPAVDAGPASGGAALSGTAVLSLDVPGLDSAAMFAAPGVTPSSRVILSLAGEPDGAENDPELLDVRSLWALPGTGTMTIGATFDTPTSGPITINWSAS